MTLTKNLFNYATGARVTCVTHAYNVSNPFHKQDVVHNHNYTIPDNRDTSDSLAFNDPTNYWNTQGAVENNDSKENIFLNHRNQQKSKSSATTMIASYNKYNGLHTIILSPLAKSRQMKVFSIYEVYMASADSDGNVGDFEIYASTSLNPEVQYTPSDPSWKLIKKGKLNVVYDLVRIDAEPFEATCIMLRLKEDNMNFMELAAFKAYGTEGSLKQKVTVLRKNNSLIVLDEPNKTMHSIKNQNGVYLKEDFISVKNMSIEKLDVVMNKRIYRLQEVYSQPINRKPLRIKLE